MILLVFASSCDGQVQTNPAKDNGTNQRATTDGQIKLIKNHFTNQYQEASDNIHCMIQDKAGNLWLSTTGDGVYCYNGKSFFNYTTKDGLNSNIVWSVMEDQAGNIWIGTNEGISLYDGKTIRSIPIILTQSQYFYANKPTNINPPEKYEVFSIIQDKSGVIWFGTTDGVYCYNPLQGFDGGGKSFTRFPDNDNVINKNRLTLNSVQCMLEDKNGNIWFGSGPMAFEGICLFDGKTLSNFKPKDEGWIRNMFEDNNGNIWLGTRHFGACLYDGKTFSWFTEKEGIGNPMLEDKAGNIWFAGGEKLNTTESDGGIWCYDGKSFKNFSTKDGLGNYSVFSMVEDKAGNIWVGTRNTGLYRYDGKIFTGFTE